MIVYTIFAQTLEVLRDDRFFMILYEMSADGFVNHSLWHHRWAKTSLFPV